MNKVNYDWPKYYKLHTFSNWGDFFFLQIYFLMNGFSIFGYYRNMLCTQWDCFLLLLITMFQMFSVIDRSCHPYCRVMLWFDSFSNVVRHCLAEIKSTLKKASTNWHHMLLSNLNIWSFNAAFICRLQPDTYCISYHTNTITDAS